MENLTPNLTVDDLKANIDALVSQKAPSNVVQSYIDNYTGDGKGGYVLKSLKQTPVQTSPEKPFGESTLGQVGNSLSNIGVGVGTTVGKAVLGVPEAVTRIAGMAGVPGATDVANTIKTAKEAIYQKPFEKQLSTTSGKVGEAIGTAATFLAPAGLASKGELAVNALSQGITSPLLAAGTRIAGKMVVQAGTAGLTDLATTGGDVQHAVKTAQTAGIVRGAMAGTGETMRAFGIPEKLYQRIFKANTQDMLAELKSTGIANLQQTNPEKYQEFVKAGIIKESSAGVPILNETIAKKALDRGLKGNIDTMSNTVVHGILDSEQQAQNIAKNYTGTVDLSEPQYTNILKKISSDYKDVGFGEISKQATDLNKAIKSGNGQVSAETALNVRRLLDKARLATSFGQPASSLSMTQSNLKTLADTARSRVNSVPGMKSVMENYSFNIDALESLAREAARKGNNQILSLIDSVLLTGGIASGHGATALGVDALRKAATSATGLTNVAQAINNPNLGTTGSAILGASSKAISQ